MKRILAISSAVIGIGLLLVFGFFGIQYYICKADFLGCFFAGPPHSSVGSPAIADRVMYFGTDGYLYAVDIENRQERWSFKAGAGASSPRIVDGVAYVGTDDGRLYAIDIQTGQERWKFITGDAIGSSPEVVDGVAYFGSEDGHLYAVDVQTGEERWRFKTEDRVWSWPSPAIADGVVYFGSFDGSLYAVNIKNGQKKWKFETRGRVLASPAVADGAVYVVSFDENLYVVDSQTGVEIPNGRSATHSPCHRRWPDLFRWRRRLYLRCGHPNTRGNVEIQNGGRDTFFNRRRRRRGFVREP